VFDLGKKGGWTQTIIDKKSPKQHQQVNTTHMRDTEPFRCYSIIHERLPVWLYMHNEQVQAIPLYRLLAPKWKTLHPLATCGRRSV
jgi:hypothetical protein